MNSKPLVIYHYPCLDGCTAAWAVWKAHPDWEFYQGKHGDAPPDVTGRDVYMVDFSYKRPILLVMADWANSITILDHHKTAQEDLKDLAKETRTRIEVLFNMDKSGARLAWEYFHPGTFVPELVKYVEDRDLWRFKYEDTKAVNAYLFSFDYDFKTWNQLEGEVQVSLDSVIGAGEAITRKQDKDVLELSQFAFPMNIAGYTVPTLNVPYTYASDTGHLLCKGKPFAASFYYDGEGFVFSLRSDEDGIDVSEIAKKFRGGGHKHAAGFKVFKTMELHLEDTNGL
jgi:hypothetical protein